MKPKEKAESLVNHFRMVLMNEDTDCGNEILCTSIAIKNSFILVNEILESFMTSIPKHQMDFWEEVKQELEKL